MNDNLNLKNYGEVISRQEEETGSENLGKRLQEKYSYFNAQGIKAGMKISLKNRKEGSALVKNGKITLEKVDGGYSNDSTGYICKFSGTGTKTVRGRQTTFPVSITIDKNSIRDVSCSCEECSMYYYYYARNDYCAYVSGLMDLVIDYTDKHSIGDGTDVSARNLLEAFHKKKKSQIMSDNYGEQDSLTLEPRLVKRDGVLGVSFKVGAEKLYVVKDVEQFADNVRSGAATVYGSNTTINHRIENFSESGREWVQFISDAATEERKMRERIWEKTWGRVSAKKTDRIELYGWRLDRFCELIKDSAIDYEDKDLKKKSFITLSHGNPKLKMIISPNKENNVFQGIIATMNLPQMYRGSNGAYYIDLDRKKLFKMNEDFYDKLGPLFNEESYGIVSLQVGRRKLSDFYYTVLPEIRDYVEVMEMEGELIEQYLSPLAKFSFYLDAPDGDVTCKVMVKYGDKEFSCLDQLKKNRKLPDMIRQLAKEKEILLRLQSMFPECDAENDMFYCDGDEDSIFELVTHGVEELAELGDVFCTKRFKNMNVVRKAKVSVGVSVSSGLLDLDVSTQELSPEELLELLKNYRGHQRYYRFKSGEYVDLNEDSLQMLFEMMETMHLSPKDFVKGKMHLPMYRTLYLDKMLEEHEEVYNTRDQVFREIVKNMKTVNDADYDVPLSLQTTMRKYQKNGFRWLKTLEANHFGGILADDMGLGKTLQTIALLLAAKKENQEGTSLVVAPASLVYNWGEEFARFAPELKVALVTGKQEERSRIIEDCRNADVLVTSYDLLKRDIDLYEGKTFEYQIIDEAQYIKNQTTAAAKSVKLINSKNKFALTGTPIENRLSELWSIFDYLMPGFLYGYEAFKKEFETPIVKYGEENASRRLQKMVNPFILRRLKSDVLKDLPDKLEETRTVRMSEEQQRLYDAQVVQMKAELASSDEADFNKKKLQILAQLTRLRQVCCDPNLCYDNYSGESAKLEACIELIQSAMDGGHRLLLFSQFTSMLEIIEKRLNESGIAYYKITGETSKKKRLEMVNDFNGNDIPVFLISLKAGGVGLNLTGADVVIHYDPWWNIAVQNQATDRAHRIGQTKKVTVYKLVVKNTIEEKILKLQESKRDLADSIISGDNAGMSSISKDELMELLGIN